MPTEQEQKLMRLLHQMNQKIEQLENRTKILENSLTLLAGNKSVPNNDSELNDYLDDLLNTPYNFDYNNL